jgi:hypothetical protein
MSTQLRPATLLLILLANVAHAAPQGAAPRAPSVEGSVPTYNIETVCRSATDTAQSCIEDERRAQEQLLKEWSQFDVADRVMCNGAARVGSVEPAYTELMACLDITRDNHRDTSAHVAQTPNPPLRAIRITRAEQLAGVGPAR